jgi:hypothetical protein
MPASMLSLEECDEVREAYDEAYKEAYEEALVDDE